MKQVVEITFEIRRQYEGQEIKKNSLIFINNLNLHLREFQENYHLYSVMSIDVELEHKDYIYVIVTTLAEER